MRNFIINNLPKIIIIFIIGMISRTCINYLLDINVFVNYFNLVSIFYYLNLSCIIVYINSIDFGIFKSISLDFIRYRKVFNIRYWINALIMCSSTRKGLPIKMAMFCLWIPG